MWYENFPPSAVQKNFKNRPRMIALMNFVKVRNNLAFIQANNTLNLIYTKFRLIVCRIIGFI